MGWTPRERLRARKAALKKARADHQKAQRKLERAARKHLKRRDRLELRVRQFADVVRAKARLVRRQRKVVNAQVPVLHPERTRISVNRSSRGGVKPRIIVLHITVSHNRPGLADIDAILDFFDRPSTQASSHIVNDREGHDARCVRDADKAWTQAAYNPQALSIEQIEYEVKSRKRWLSESMPQLENTARGVAHWSKRYGIPLVHSTRHGVCQHRDLGAAGGGHVDCSPDYPLDVVLNLARKYRDAL